ncbi:unnamed protein product [Brachionus calyciflorus]|uniref:Uncharacterized protein n=1 Tax=Brachionus calyciflorus TaxID=104777 RepID=A0A813Y2V2_9BILA|nr:unnamed protein product [Brachionus calyciflorus]
MKGKFVNDLQEDILQSMGDSVDVLQRARNLVPPVFQAAQLVNRLVELPNLINQMRDDLNEPTIAINEMNIGINFRINQIEQNYVARSLNASAIRENSLIVWIRVGDKDPPHRCKTFGQFNRLSPRQLIDLLHYYNLPAQRTQILNRRILGRLIGVPAYV